MVLSALPQPLGHRLYGDEMLAELSCTLPSILPER